MSLALLAVGGCGGFGLLGGKEPPKADAAASTATVTPEPPPQPDLLAGIELTADAKPVTTPLVRSAGRNEWVSLVLRVHAPAAGRPAWLTLPTWTADGKPLRVKAAKVYQVLPMPLDVNRAAYVRQTGMPVAAESLPRALLPVVVRDGRIDLTTLRDPARPAAATATAVDRDVLLWVDVRVAIDAVPGQYAGTFDYVAGPTPENAKAPPVVAAGLAATLNVADFVLPDDRHLTMAADLSWERLRRLWPERFEAARPQLLSRTDPGTKAAVATLDALMNLSQENRVQIHVPRLQPVVKWKPGPQAIIDWDDYDNLVGPWLSGEQFPDKVPLGFWALPRIDFLSNVQPAAQEQYYVAAASHFDQRDWLRVSPVILTKPTPGRANVTERLVLSAEASRVLGAHPRVRVLLPLEPAELQMANNGNANLISPADTGRLNCVAPGLISNSSLGVWPANLDRPQNWLRTDLAGLIPYTGAGGDESDVRVWSWVAFLRKAGVIQWDGCLPAENDPAKPADPNELVWFYPGSWFGVEEPVQTVQLKWLRQAQQDFEYLYLANQRGSLLDVLPMARVLAKPVEIQPGQSPEPVYGLLIGTADARAWASVKPLLVRTLQARGPGIQTDADTLNALGLDQLHWIEPLERPVIIARRTEWSVGAPPAGQPGPWVNLKLGFDLYNASDTTPERNELTYARVTGGWVVPPAATAIPRLSMFQVARQNLSARLNPGEVDNAHHVPVRIEYKSGQKGQSTPLDVVAPVSRCARLGNLLINGSLDDWSDDDALQLGPLVKMMSRPAVQEHALQYADTASKLYSGWGDDDFYFAFNVTGLSRTKPVLASRNFVEYQDGRAWGEDVCQAVVQGVYDDGTAGPQIHIAVKPGGNVWVEKRDRPGRPWEPFQAGVRYASTDDKAAWRGEMAIPWTTLIDPAKTDELAKQGRPNVPTILRFNFIQHKHDSGESASWAGPVDAGRDSEFGGVLVVTP